jgi:hypothetical protein
MTPDEIDLLQPGPTFAGERWLRSVSLYERRETGEMSGVRFG